MIFDQCSDPIRYKMYICSNRSTQHNNQLFCMSLENLIPGLAQIIKILMSAIDFEQTFL